MKKILFLMLSLFVLLMCGCASFEKLQRDADGGDEIAQVLMGLKYFYGNSDVAMIHYDDARRYFEAACRRENPLACYYMGEIYEFGLGGTAVDYEKAKQFYSRAAATMSDLPSVLRKPAYLAVGKMYERGRGFEASESKARIAYEKAYNYEVDGSAACMAEFLRRTRGEMSLEQLESVLSFALEANSPHANYLYGMAIMKSDAKKGRELLRKAADANHPQSVIQTAVFSKNRMLLRSAYEKAASMGYGPAFYELALTAGRDDKRYELLKKSADRGHVAAIQALGDFFESQKKWNSATIYHYMANRLNGVENTPASVRLSRAAGLNLPVESIWASRPAASLAEMGTNIEYFIRSYRAGIVKIRENYQRYIADNPQKIYVNMDYVRLFNEKMPMVMAGDIFRIYYDSVHGAVGNDFYLNYAIAAGYAGQGSIQFCAADKINLKYNSSQKLQWAKILLKANGLALMGNSTDAYELILAAYRGNLSDEDVLFIIDFVNGNCNMLLKDIAKLSAALNINSERFVAYRAWEKHDFYDLDKRCDISSVTVPTEPAAVDKK